MWKKTFFISIFLFLVSSFPSFAYDTWLKETDTIFCKEIYNCLDGGYIFGGRKTDEIGKRYFVLTKTDPSGNPLWAKSYIGEKNINPSSFKKDLNGHYYMLGYTEASDGDQLNILILKLDESGNIIWQKRYFTDGDDYCGDGIILHDKILLYSLNPSDINSFVIFTINLADGEIIWQKKYLGSFSRVVTIGGGESDEFYISFLGEKDRSHISLVVKIDSNGDIMWQKVFRSDSEMWITDIKEKDGNVFLTYRKQGGNVSRSVGILEMDRDGTILRKRIFSPPSVFTGLPKLKFLSGDEMLILSQNSEDNSNWNSWIFKLDSAWQPVWERTFSIENNDNIQNLIESTDGGYVGVGYISIIQNFTSIGGFFFKLNSGGSFDFYCPLENEIVSSVTENFDVQVADKDYYISGDYNLVALETTISPENSNITLSDLCSPSCPTITISPSTLPSGKSGESYSVQLSAEGGSSPYKFSLFSGKLPDGLTLSGNGVISGTPTEGGDFNFTVSVADSQNCGAKVDYILHIEIVSPTISQVSKLSNPFRLKIKGSNFHQDLKVYIGDDQNSWSNVKYKSSSEIVLKGGTSLKSKFPKGVLVKIKIVNGDGGVATFTFTR
jgi:hypothetical protein